MPVSYTHLMAQTDAAGQQAVLAVIAARHGSTPREIGAKMLVRTDGSIVGLSLIHI